MAEQFAHKMKPAEDVEFPDWATTYLMAWQALRDDRTLGPNGMPSGIWYASISRYCDDISIPSGDRNIFMVLLTAMDAEYIAVTAERIKDAFDKAKSG